MKIYDFSKYFSATLIFMSRSLDCKIMFILTCSSTWNEI